jgi:uncharacterized membrane protein
VKLVVISLLLAMAGFTLFSVVFANRVVEPFSELGILGPNLKIGDYPRELEVGEEFQLYLYLGNHEGRTMYYRILAKLGSREVNITDEEPLNAPILEGYERILMDGTNYTLPIAMSIPEEGLNQRLVFEMHVYDPGMEDFRYHERWTQLWLNVTKTTN